MKTAPRGCAPKDGLITPKYSMDKPRLARVWEQCPRCRWKFISRVCCDSLARSVGTVCPRCYHQFLSVAS